RVARLGRTGTRLAEPLGRLRVRTVLVVTGVALLGRQHDEPDPADAGDQVDQDPPAGAVGVVHPPDGNTDGRQQHREAVDRREHTTTAVAVVRADDLVHDAQNDR